MALSITFDHAQRRLLRDRIALCVLGSDLKGLASNTVYDLETHTTFLRPYAADDAWWTTSSGNYAKLVKASYTLTTSANWKDVAPFAGFGYYLLNQGGINEPVITTASYGKNRAFWLSFFSFGSGDVFEQLRCGWNSTATIAGGVGLSFWSDGTVYVYKGGDIVGTYSVSASDPRTMMNQRPAFFLIPGRRRELMVLSTIGGSFSHVFEDIDEDDSDPEITPAGKFWWEIPTSRAEIALAPMKFYSSGYACSVRCALAEAPETGATFEAFDNDAWAGGSAQDYKIFGDESFEGTVSAEASLVETDGTTAFVSDGSLIDCRVRVDLDGDNDYTPFIYGAQVSFAPTFADTDDSEVYEDGIDRLLACSLDVPSDPGGATLSLEIMDPVDAESDIPKLLKIANRPVLAKIGDVPFLDGLSEPVHYVKAMRGPVETASMEVRTRWKQFENYMFRERISLRQMEFSDAVVFIASTVGMESADIVVSSTSLVLGDAVPADSDDDVLEIQIGDTAAQWLRRLHEDYAASWFMDIVPTVDGLQLWLRSPADLDADDDAATLWATKAAAVAGLQLAPYSMSPSAAAAAAWKFVYREFRSGLLEPEANEVRVGGYDPRLRREIQSFKRDEPAMDPTLAPSLRPDNWLGEPRRYGLLDPAITSQTLADASTELLYDRLTPSPSNGEWASEFIVDLDGVPAWRGRNVTLSGIGRFRIETLAAQFEKEPDGSDTWQWRESRYCAELRST